MKQPLSIPYYNLPSTNIEDFLSQLSKTSKHLINHNPWNYEFSGEAGFNIAYIDAGIFLKFNVIEESVLATYTKINDPVYRDSCVEFFISLNNEKSYYNFEFNPTGTCLAGYGTSVDKRELLSTEKIKQINIVSSSFKSIVFKEQEMINWQLTLFIPNQAFQFHKIESFKGQKANVNFYKCGDDLPNPHYLCWNPITNTPEPNFHLPNYFGEAKFINN